MLTVREERAGGMQKIASTYITLCIRWRELARSCVGHWEPSHVLCDDLEVWDGEKEWRL